MRLFFLSVFFSLALLGYSFSVVADNSLTLTIITKSKEKGEVLIAVFASEKGFPYEGERATKLAKCKPVSGKCSVSISDLPPGKYAVSVFQDRNGDEKFNTNFLGIPQEGYGVSNNAISTFRAPTYQEALFQHKSSTSLEIRLTY
ncbi:MAG: DUF2141 domain-containing protein [Bacteroidota bacterium]